MTVLTKRDALEKEVNATVKQVLSITEAAARTPPIIACEPYAVEERRKRLIRAMWKLYKEIAQAARDGVFDDLE